MSLDLSGGLARSMIQVLYPSNNIVLGCYHVIPYDGLHLLLGLLKISTLNSEFTLRKLIYIYNLIDVNMITTVAHKTISFALETILVLLLVLLMNEL